MLNNILLKNGFVFSSSIFKQKFILEKFANSYGKHAHILMGVSKCGVMTNIYKNAFQ